MKKIVLGLLCCLFILSGCGSKQSKSLDLEKTKQNLLASKYFTNHEALSIDTFEKRYSLNLNGADALIIMSKSYDDASMILIVKNNADLKKEIDAFVSAYNSQWVTMNYFPEQKEIVEKALYRTINDYIIYIVSENNNEVLNIVNV